MAAKKCNDRRQGSTALQPAQHEEQSQPGDQALLDAPGEGKADQGQQQHCTHQPPPQAVKILRPKKLLEAGQIHALVQDFILRDGLILVKNPVPCGIRQRWQSTDDRIPAHDGKA
jgi:hypothetical protein